MSDLRYDPIDDNWVVIAGNRQSRPMEFVAVVKQQATTECPFCRGNEALSTPAVAAFDASGQVIADAASNSDWQTRVITNKYPSFAGSAVAGKRESPPSVPPPLQATDQAGYQELIIPSPRHCVSLSELSDEELDVALMVLQNRLQTIRQKSSIKHSMLFANCRSAAGASLSHIHWQLIGTPIVSSFLANRAQRQLLHQQQHDASLVKTLVDWEMQQGLRVIAETDNFCLVCPFASRFPFQVNIVPKNSRMNFFTCPAEIRSELGRHCRDIVRRLETVIEPDVAYNILFQLPPLEHLNDVPWYVQIFPRITKQAGVELGTDIWINTVSPESAATLLRDSCVLASNE